MRHALLLVFVVLALALAGCGDDSSKEDPAGLPTDFDPSDPNAIGSLIRSISDAELTDEVMEELYEIRKRVAQAKDDPQLIMSVFKSSRWNVASYGKAMLKFEALRTAARRGPEKLQKQLAEAKAELTQVEAELAQATGDAKQALEQKLSMAKTMLPMLEADTQLAQKLKDPKVSALVEKWSERFDALDNE